VKTVEVKINGQSVQADAAGSILDAAKLAGTKIPILCAHPDLTAWGACGICIVKIEGNPRLVRACTTKVVPGQNYITHDPEIQKIRKTVIELILSNHPQECLTCARNQACELQKLATDFCIREVPYDTNIMDLPKDTSTESVILDPVKCVQCGRCALVCQSLQDVWALEFLERGEKTRLAPSADVLLDESPCIKCGQCAAHCPVGAIYEKDETDKFLAAVLAKNTHVSVQIAPAIRVALGEAFGMKPGSIVTGKIYAALRKLGADSVFDTNFGADLTVMEEGSEFVEKFLNRKGDLPQLTSCCPAWTDYMEKYYPDMIPHFSTAKSPMMMQGAMAKTYFAQQKNLDPKDIYSVAIMPCTAKKFEIRRSSDMNSSGAPDVDLVLTTRELGRLIKMAGIDFENLADEKADSPIGLYTGAGTIFGVTGGVMEAALRTAYKLVAGEELKNVEINPVRGTDGVKKGVIDIKGTAVKVAAAHGMINVKSILEEIREAKKTGKPMPYDFVEVMACYGGCIAGGGQPYETDDKVRAARTAGLYTDDAKSQLRCSHLNPEILHIYEKFLGKPCSDKAHKYLHTHYQKRPVYKK